MLQKIRKSIFKNPLAPKSEYFGADVVCCEVNCESA